MNPTPFMLSERDSIRRQLACFRENYPTAVVEVYAGMACGLALDMVDGVGPEGAASVFYEVADDIVAKHPKPFKMPPKPTPPPVARYTVPRDRSGLIAALLFPLGLTVGLILASLS